MRPSAVLAFLLILAPQAARAATVSGFVRSAEDGEALSYANVSIKGTKLGDVTNAQGFYSLARLPTGTYTISFSYLGFTTQNREVTLAEDDAVTLSLELAPLTIPLEGVEVEAESNPRLAPSRLTIRTQELNAVPSVADADLFRALQALPGVSTLSDFSSGLYVRGGSPDQNLILLDDVDVYDPSHLFGFFSTFNVDAVKTVDLQKSAYPARYGGRLSSLLDVHNRDGNRKEFEGVGRTSLLSSSLTLEGPWARGSWMLSGRRTHIGTLAKAANIDLPYRFYDLNAKVNFDAGENDRTTAGGFRGSDRLDWDQNTVHVVLDWGNDTGSAQWTHIFNNTVFSQFLVGGSRFHSDAQVSFQDFEFRWKNRVEDIAAKGSLSFEPAPSHLVDLGFETKSLDFLWRQDIGAGDRLTFQYRGVYAAVYAQDEWKARASWRLQPGLRLDYYSKGNYAGLGPRLTAEKTINDALSVHAAYGRYYQYLNLVSQEGASFADMWFPVDKTLEPGRADHYVLGADVRPHAALDAKIEVYYKDYRNLVEFSSEFTRSLIDPNATLGDLFDTGTGRAFGADLYLRNHLAGFNGWIGYAWGVTKRKVEQYNRGQEYTPSYDRRHQFTFMESRPLGRDWMLDLSFRYGTGQPTTLAAGRYTVTDATGRSYDAVLPGELNAARLPDFHRLDLGLSRRWSFHSWSLTPSLQIINVYNHKNVYIRTYDLTKNPVEFKDLTMLPLIPTIGVDVNF